MFRTLVLRICEVCILVRTGTRYAFCGAREESSSAWSPPVGPSPPVISIEATGCFFSPPRSCEAVRLRRENRCPMARILCDESIFGQPRDGAKRLRGDVVQNLWTDRHTH
jgi:hypothetical protein